MRLFFPEIHSKIISAGPDWWISRCFCFALSFELISRTMQWAARISTVKSYVQPGLGKVNLILLVQKFNCAVLITHYDASAHFAPYNANPKLLKTAALVTNNINTFHNFKLCFHFSVWVIRLKPGCVSSCSLFKSSTMHTRNFSAFGAEKNYQPKPCWSSTFLLLRGQMSFQARVNYSSFIPRKLQYFITERKRRLLVKNKTSRK